MYIRMLLIAITFLIFPVGTSNLYALPWCGCGNCMTTYAIPPKCTCGYPYYWCLEDLRALQLQASLHNRSAENKLYSRSLGSHDHSISSYGRCCVPNQRREVSSEKSHFAPSRETRED